MFSGRITRHLIHRRPVSLGCRPLLSVQTINIQNVAIAQWKLSSVRWNSNGSNPISDRKNSDNVADGVNTGLNSSHDDLSTPLSVIDSVENSDIIIEKFNAVLGWNPVDIVMYGMDQIHVVTGLPYWGSIMLFTVGMRFVLLPIAIKGAVNANRMQHLKPDMERVQAALKASQEGGINDPKSQQRFQLEMKELFVKHQVNPFNALMMPFLQMPIFISAFMALRQMHEYFPGYSSGGALWFTDLSAADPYYILPVINALTFLIMIEVGADGMDASTQGTFKNIMRVLGVTMIPLTASMPQVILALIVLLLNAELLYFLSSYPWTSHYIPGTVYVLVYKQHS